MSEEVSMTDIRRLVEIACRFPRSSKGLRNSLVRTYLPRLIGDLEALRAENAALKADAERLNWCADDRIFDGIGGLDIDDICSEMVTGDSEDEWKACWRIAFRKAIDATMRSAEGR